MAVYIGSARIDERRKASGGSLGDQKQTSTPDYKGEVSMEKFYVSSKGWNILRPKKTSHAMGIAGSMITACNNKNIGYDQSNRTAIFSTGTNARTKTECDCSSLVRQCVIEATGVVPGQFTTANEYIVLMSTQLFDGYKYKAGMTLYTGDILVTCTKGHTVVVTNGAARSDYNSGSFYPVYQGNTTSIVTALKSVGETDTSYQHREKIASVNDIKNYKGTATQNTTMLNLLKRGKLKKG